jgi:hypothetical protein
MFQQPHDTTALQITHDVLARVGALAKEGLVKPKEAGK